MEIRIVGQVSSKRHVRNYLKQIGPTTRLARSKVAPHYEALESILGAGHSFRAAYRYLVEELQVAVGFSTMVEYVLRRRRSEAKHGNAAGSDGATPSAVQRALPATAALKATSTRLASPDTPPGMVRLGSVTVPEGGTSDWSVLSAIRRNAEQDFRELGEAAKRRKRERRGYS